MPSQGVETQYDIWWGDSFSEEGCGMRGEEEVG